MTTMHSVFTVVFVLLISIVTQSLPFVVCCWQKCSIAVAVEVHPPPFLALRRRRPPPHLPLLFLLL